MLRFGRLIGLMAKQVAKVYATWNPSDKSSNITLSNGNLTCDMSANLSGSVRATLGKSSGKWYWECTPTHTSNWIGIANSSASLTDEFAASTDGWAYRNTGVKSKNGDTAYGASYTTSDVIGIALDMDGGTITFYKNNASQGVAFTGLTGTMYPAWGIHTSTNLKGVIANFGATALTYTPPAGYNAGVY